MGILTAGDIDDNLNFDAFQTYLNSASQADSSQVLPAVTINDRVEIHVTDDSGAGAANARVTITAQGSPAPLIDGYCNSEGVFHFFPALDGAETAQFVIKVRPPEAEIPSREVTLDLNSLANDRTADIVLQGYNSTLPTSLDLTFVIDTTGSMSDELSYLRN